jgi:peptide/nickel transport system substrate-binding protein
MARVYDSFLRQRLSRRRLLGGAAALSSAGFVIAACGGGSGKPGTGTTPSATEGTPKPGGILKQQQALAYPNFSPFGPGISALTQGLFLGFTVFDHLWYVPTDTGETINFLANKIEIIDPYQIKVTMADAVFHNKPPVNGRAVTPADVKASTEKFQAQIPFGFSWLQEIFDHIDTPDDHTVIYYQKRPWFWFFTSSNAGSPITSSILPQEILDKDDILQNDPIGSGRFVLAGHNNFTNIKLRKFDRWREPGLPYLDGVDNVLLTDTTAAQASFEAKDIDTIGGGGITGGLNHEQIADLKNRLGNSVVSTSDVSRAYRTLMVHFTAPFTDERIRHAINLAINRDEIRQVMDLGDGRFCGPVPPAHKVYALSEDDKDLKEFFRFNADEAKRMLEDAGFPFDQEFELKYHTLPGNPDLAGILQQQLSKVGIKLKLTGEDISRWLSNTLGPGNFQLTCFTHLPYEDPSLPLSFYRKPNFMGYEDADVEAAMEAAAVEQNNPKRIDLTKEAQRVIIRKWAPQYTLYSPITYDVRWSYLKGTVDGRGSYGLFNSRAWLDK